MFQHITECFRWNICSYMWCGSLGVLSLTVIILSACLHRFHQRVKRLERSKAQQLEQEPQYASLQKLPVSSSKLMDREGEKARRTRTLITPALLGENPLEHPQIPP